MKNNSKTTLVLLLVLGLVMFVAYYNSSSTSEKSGATEERLAAVQEVEVLLAKVQAISLDFAILESREFVYLKDQTSPILNLPVGRPNPFAPVRK